MCHVMCPILQIQPGQVLTTVAMVARMRRSGLTMMPMAPSARLALRLVGAVGTRTTFCDSSACMLATCMGTPPSHSCIVYRHYSCTTARNCKSCLG